MTITERVAAGAAFLDEHEPGWWKRIDLGRLDLDVCTDCIIGQLYAGDGYFHDALRALGIPGDGEGVGFWPRGTGDRGAIDLTEEWARVITARREASHEA